LHPVQQHRDVPLPVLLRAADGQALVHHRPERELVDQAGEDPEDEHAAALAAGVNRLAYRDRPVRLEP
jgi:hypothetical protein